jgi:uncharacterized protein
MQSHHRGQSTAIARKAMKIVAPQFRLDLRDGIHGVSHWSRVWVHGQFVAATLQVNPSFPAWFAFLHGSQRRNDDGTDPQHGPRAADFAVGLRNEAVVTELDNREFEHLCEAMRLRSNGHTLAEPAIQTCWDADRLDLARVGLEPHPRYLSSPHAKQTAADHPRCRAHAHVHEAVPGLNELQLEPNDATRSRAHTLVSPSENQPGWLFY